MISLGSRDGRKGIGLGFDVPRQMEETELEEGEACSFQDDDPSIDPDIALSYIDKKIQDVLGDFQKDFEGGVSAENLGAKFGGYGSFLPAYQRSPVWSHPRSPPRAQSCNTFSSPNNFQVEGGRLNHVVMSTAPQAKGELASAGTVPLHACMLPSGTDSSKRDVCNPSTRAQEFPARSNPPDQKMLKVRIKVGSDNLSTRKNDEIYSGLGLVSPSSSLDESPAESEGFSHEPLAPDNSPTSILQIMASFPVHGGLLLSPLSDDLLSLTEKERILRDFRSGPSSKSGRDIPSILGNGPVSVNSYEKALGNKKAKAVGKNGFPVELGNGSKKNNQNGTGVSCKKELEIDSLAVGENGFPVQLENGSKKYSQNGIDASCKKELEIDSLVCEELVSKTSKLPISTNSCSSGGTDRRKGCADKPNGKVGSAEKAWEEEKANSLKDASIGPCKDSDRKSEKTSDPIKADSSASKGKRSLHAEPLDPPKGKTSQKVAPLESESSKEPVVRGLSSSGGKKKPKGSQNHGNPPDSLKENLRVDSSLFPKNKKSTHADDCLPKCEMEGFKLQKDFGKAYDRYEEFFGDMKLEEDNGMDSLETSAHDRMDIEVVDKCTSVSNNGLKDRFSGKKIEKTSKLETDTRVASSDLVDIRNIEIGRGMETNGNIHMSDATPGTVAPAVENEFWVLCDKCQTWRLLPIGIMPSDLPDKWECSMLDWLPGMNRCGFTQEETTKALQELQQLHAFQSQNNMHGHGDAVVAAVNVDDVQNLDRIHQNHSLQSVPSSGMVKHGLKEISNTTNHDARVQLPNSMKDLQEKWEHSSHGGDTKKLKTKSRRDIDQDGSRVPKKIKTEGLVVSDGERVSIHAGATKKAAPSSSCGLPTNTAMKHHPKYKDCSSSKDLKRDVSVKKQKNEVQASMDDRSIDSVKRKITEAAKKRAEKDRLCHDRGGCVKEEASESEQRKKKKARLLTCEGGKSNPRKASGRTVTLSQQSLDGLDSVKKDSGSLQPSVAATSSSSKVSGSHKTRANFQELKGSPVESVSSSPLRISNPGISKSTRRSIFGKDDSRDGGLLVQGSSIRCSDGEDDGRSDRCGIARKDKNENSTHRRPLDSSELDFRDREYSHSSGNKVKQKIDFSELSNHDAPLCGGDALGHDIRCSNEHKASDNFHNEEVKTENLYHANGSSLQPKDNECSDNGMIKIGDSLNEYQDPAHLNKAREGKNKFQEKIGSKSDRVDKSSIGKKGKSSSENSKRESLSKFEGHDVPDVKVHNICRQNAVSSPNQNQLLDHDDKRFSRAVNSGKTGRTEVVSERGNSLPIPTSRGGENETLSHCQQPASGSQRLPGPNILSVNAPDGVDGLPVAKNPTKVNNISEKQHISSRQSTPNGHRGSEVDARSPARRDSTSQAANSALKEAKNLKHMADRVKNSGSNLDRTGLYFQAALKFLHGASLLESCSSDGTKHADMIQAMQIYSSTAKLCEFCAREYERFKDMATAALAYKCMEVAYMRVIYSSHTTAGRDRQELQLSLPMVPPGESPSSSASDVDNLNNPPTADKVALAKGVSSPQVAGSHVIAARSRPNYLRLLNFAQDVNSAMEASRKSCIAFAAANVRLEDARYKEGLSSVKTALDFNFQNMEGLLRLVRLAMEAFSKG